MKTKTHKNNPHTQNVSKNKTRKNKMRIKLLKMLKKGTSIYAAKEYKGDKILTYTKKNAEKEKSPCILNNMSWFSKLDRAKLYKNNTHKIYQWTIIAPTPLLPINKSNRKFFEYIFTHSVSKLEPYIELTDQIMKKIKYEHPYLLMSTNERAYYEFKFAYGYMPIHEQYNFLMLIKYLLKENIVHLQTRGKNSILPKVIARILYYTLNDDINNITTSKHRMNRLSIYNFDRRANTNICTLLKEYNYTDISGTYVPPTTSFWHIINFVTNDNLEEYVLFNPHKNLEYTSEV